MPFRLDVYAGRPELSARRAADAVQPGGVLYYALGGGLGHLVRALAVGRAFRRIRAEPFSILTNCFVDVADGETLLRLADERETDAGMLAGLVAALVSTVRPSVLAVDAFPAGILGELAALLPALPTRRAGVLRRLQARWAVRWDLPAVLPLYDVVLLVEPGARLPGCPAGARTVETAPILLRNSAELLPRAEARRRLRCEGELPLVCAVATGKKAADRGLLEAARRAVGRAAPGAALRLATPFPGGMPAGEYAFHFPLLECLSGVELVVGGCGYNLCHETAAAGTPAVFVPQARLYDDQFARAAGRPVAASPAELERLLGEALSRPLTPRPPPAYENGADEAARTLAELLP